MLKKIRSLFPASSRLAHSMFDEIVNIRNQNEKIIQHLIDIEHKISELDEWVKSDSSQNNAFQRENQELLWRLYKIPNESFKTAKLRFFHSMTKATGKLRDYQMSSLELFEQFNEICKSNNIDYFAISGTLLGSIRHSGFIPWDDDIDVGIMREDLFDLLNVVNNSPDYKITIVYDTFVCCKQIRFTKSSTTENCPFLDIFLFDWATGDSLKNNLSIKNSRSLLMESIINDPTIPKNSYISSDNPVSKTIQSLIDHYNSNLLNEGVICKKEDGRSIIWSIDNFMPYSNSLNFNTDLILPLKLAPFESLMVPTPKNADCVLDRLYDNWLQIPPDFQDHWHVDFEAQT